MSKRRKKIKEKPDKGSNQKESKQKNSTITKETPNTGFKIMINDYKPDRAIIPVIWCLTKKGIKILEEQETNPEKLFVLIVIKHIDSKKEIRVIERYVKGGTALQFKSTGEHNIYGILLEERDYVPEEKRESLANYSTKQLTRIQDFFLRKEYGKYKTDVIDSQGELLPIIRGSFDVFVGQHLESIIPVMIDGNLFAKKPNPWIWWWVNLWFTDEAKDTCQFWRRFIFPSIIPQVPSIFIYTLIRGLILFLIASFFFLLGKRGIGWEAIIHPFIYSFNHVWNNDIIEKDEKKWRWGFGWGGSLWFLSPLILLVIYGISWIIYPFIIDSYPSWKVVTVFIGSVLFMFVLSSIFFFLILPIYVLLENWLISINSKIVSNSKEKEEERKSKKREERKALIAVLENEERIKRELALNQFTCETTNPEKVNEIASERRKLHLGFWMNKKSKSCKPFAS